MDCCSALQSSFSAAIFGFGGRNKAKKLLARIPQMGKIVVAVIVSLWVIPLSLFVNHIVPEPYMDEIFHIPQTQQYCRGNFKSWDPKITTPPGLYLFSLAHVASLFPGMWYAKAVSSFSELCSTAFLRSTNGVLAVICSVLVYEILTHLRPALDKRKATLYAIVLSLYPLHWFFTFLYYTDVASLSVVLAMYLACLKRHYRFSAVLGAVAILVRQTNVVWMLLVACTGAINLTLPPNHKENVHVNDPNVSVRKNEGLADDKSMTGDPKLRKRKNGSTSDVGNCSIVGLSDSSFYHPSGLFDEIQVILLRMWHLKLEVLVSFGPFAMVLLAFIMFVFWNGSIVLGAKEDHEVSQHFAQLMYFGLVSALAMAPFCFSFSQIARICRSFWKNKPPSFFLLFVILVVGFLSVHLYSIAHPYLLADKRHYTFSLWRKLTSHWSTKYLLLPLYAFSWFSIFDSLGKVQRRIWVLAFSLALAAVLVPAPLIEFRYYTTPFYFLVLHSPWINVSDNRSWFLMGILYMAVNIFTITMFLFRTFEWKHEPGITQRFIW